MTIPIYRRAIKPLEAGIGDELVALDVKTGDCFGFNEVAATIWRQLESPKSFDQLRDTLLEEYDVNEEQCAAELQELLDDLVEKGLLASDAD